MDNSKAADKKTAKKGSKRVVKLMLNREAIISILEGGTIEVKISELESILVSFQGDKGEVRVEQGV